MKSTANCAQESDRSKRKHRPSFYRRKIVLTAGSLLLLATVVAETKACVYFINSEEPSQLDALQAFRSTYGIPTVPGFLHVESGEVTVRHDHPCPKKKSKTAHYKKK